MKPLISKALAGVLGHAIDVSFEVIRHDEEPLSLLPPPEDDVAIPDFMRKRTAQPPALNPAHTFDSFVVGEENRLAFDAAWKVAHEPGTVSPLVIFGTSGLGKTHLLNAIGHVAYAAGKSVIYAPAERFGNDYVRALKDGPEKFRQRYRNCDVLLIDDVQFFEGKEKFQAEFFHAFNDLTSSGAQIVVTADRPPAQLALMDALRSRLQWGLAVDLQRPSFETRLAILRAKAAQHATQLPEEALRTIAEKCCPSVRELEGYLNRVIAFMPLVGGTPTKDLVERALSPLQGTKPDAEPEGPCDDDVIAAVCRRTGAQPADLRGRSRNRQVAYARHTRDGPSRTSAAPSATATIRPSSPASTASASN
jgi:chromosomal replication initiator protein